MNVNEYIEKYGHHHFQETPCGDCVKDAISIMGKLSKLTQQLKDENRELKLENSHLRGQLFIWQPPYAYDENQDSNDERD